MMVRTSLLTARAIIGSGNKGLRRRGLTLAECVFALVVMPLAVTAVAYAVTAGQMQSAEALRRSRAAMLAEALMEEILARPYNDPQGASVPGPESGETTRAGFDNADDYHNFSETAGNLKNAGGISCPAEYQAFSRSVACLTGSVTLAGLGPAAPGLNITVNVTDLRGTACTLRRFMVMP